jgi:uncharacterized protein involved in exopolysaccharide biosynthesis
VSHNGEIKDIQTRIKDLESRLADLEERLPAHSIPPNLITEMDKLDEQIQVEKKRLEELLEARGSSPSD